MTLKGISIYTFQFNHHFAYYWNGTIKVGCESFTPQEWLDKAEELGKKHNYTEDEISMYLNFIQWCNDLSPEMVEAAKYKPLTHEENKNYNKKLIHKEPRKLLKEK